MVPLHVKVPPSNPQMDKQYSKMFTRAGRIVSRNNTKRKTASLLKRLKKKNLSGQEKEEVRVKLKKRLSAALVKGGISPEITETTTMVFVNLIMEGIEIVHTEPGESIVMYLKCESVKSLLSLRDMVLSGFLLELLCDAIEEFIHSRPEIQLIIKADDYNMCLSYLTAVSGEQFLCILLVILFTQTQSSTSPVFETMSAEMSAGHF